ncbi:NAD(P)-dependent oxidoreductase [Enterobacteriaceae bacterium BIT-l23]|uniref:NAD-dependent epimerase/dehydratase family protein n=1 Tax=Jejubacter sp. L23 TaxID=3092086 RepID=UPI00158584CA|nr:NAD(P)-dependent oxidoreductase [Enterobacteriaceae bacterium BIT-l23]
MNQKNVLVTGANGYIGNAVAKAFSRAGWKVYGLIRRPELAQELARQEIFPVIGSPENLTFMAQISDVAFDVIVSNTEDQHDAAGHLAKVRTMMDALVASSEALGVRSLVMFSSGCKDYGRMSEKHGDPTLAPHSENSPINPPDVLLPRSNLCSNLLDKRRTPFDVVILRPTIVYGHSSSYYGALFELAANSQGTLSLMADPNAVMHACHVDDCAEAYVMLAEHPDQSQVVNQVFNISNARYETARQIGEALARSYGLALQFVSPEQGKVEHFNSAHGLANFWQWVGSDKIRRVTGWQTRRPSFVQGLEQYRLAYEATLVGDDSGATCV